MALYNIIFGKNESSAKLLGFLGKTEADFGRFRDVYLEDGHIVVYARTGGGNRDDYADMYDEMSAHPWYSYDEDSDYDNTYARIYFKIPDDGTRTLIELSMSGKSKTPDENWASISNPDA